jgi:hypothetical protein
MGDSHAVVPDAEPHPVCVDSQQAEPDRPAPVAQPALQCLLDQADKRMYEAKALRAKRKE